MAISDYIPFIPAKQSAFVTESGAPIHGLLAQFDTPADVYHAAEKVRDAGYKHWDVHAPFPIHGIEEAMGVKRSILPFIIGGAAATGVILALLMQYFMNAIDYQFVVQGKDYFAWEAYIPITFELAVLLSAFAAITGMLALNGLPRFNHPLFQSERFLDSTDHCYFVAIEARDPSFDPATTLALLRDSGASHIELIEEPQE
jgi:hypothetical protein